MIRRPTRSTRTDTLFPYTTLFRSHDEEPRSMNDSNGYAVFFFPQALEALGDAIKPYLQESPAGAHVVCNEIDTGCALLAMTLHGHDSQERDVELELQSGESRVGKECVRTCRYPWSTET